MIKLSHSRFGNEHKHSQSSFKNERIICIDDRLHLNHQIIASSNFKHRRIFLGNTNYATKMISFTNDCISKTRGIEGYGVNVNNITVISWRSVLLVEETGVPGENHQIVASHRHTLSHNVVSSTLRLSGIRIHNVSGDRH